MKISSALQLENIYYNNIGEIHIFSSQHYLPKKSANSKLDFTVNVYTFRTITFHLSKFPFVVCTLQEDRCFGYEAKLIFLASDLSAADEKQSVKTWLFTFQSFHHS